MNHRYQKKLNHVKESLHGPLAKVHTFNNFDQTRPKGLTYDRNSMGLIIKLFLTFLCVPNPPLLLTKPSLSNPRYHPLSHSRYPNPQFAFSLVLQQQALILNKQLIEDFAKTGLLALLSVSLSFTDPALAFKGGGPYGSEVTRGQDFSGRTLIKQDFKTSMLRQANFKGAKLLGASFFDADLTGCSFERGPTRAFVQSCRWPFLIRVNPTTGNATRAAPKRQGGGVIRAGLEDVLLGDHTRFL
ncbi:hypothetical protein SADUNF_Sadunf10G0154000 [Salix dunnii]|uniref:Pentapeptide repeat-containing protein n=1 Tax=Salix dunnii TaxID=1413687 RepID=A0A835JUH0_9ROSI|nr:hypothetical protein SADUNF_Sadunf10G0154000 [Salix dunnii]